MFLEETNHKTSICGELLLQYQHEPSNKAHSVINHSLSKKGNIQQLRQPPSAKKDKIPIKPFSLFFPSHSFSSLRSTLPLRGARTTPPWGGGRN